MLNSVILIGRLTKDPELKYTPTGNAVANFTLAVDSGFGDKKQTDFLNIVAWGKTGEISAEYLHKGSLCSVEGRISTRNYKDKNDRTVYVTEIVAATVIFLDSKEKSGLKPKFPEELLNGSKPIKIEDDDLPLF